MIVLRQEYEEAGKSEYFQMLEEFLAAPPDRHEYALVESKLGMKEGSVTPRFRFRSRFSGENRARCAS